MDLQADKKVAFRVEAQDEVGNPTQFQGAISFSLDDPAGVLTLTDNGDGSGEIAATGTLGTAILTATAQPPTGPAIVRAEAINLIAGDAAAFTFAFGSAEEVTPDEPAPQ